MHKITKIVLIFWTKFGFLALCVHAAACNDRPAREISAYFAVLSRSLGRHRNGVEYFLKCKYYSREGLFWGNAVCFQYVVVVFQGGIAWQSWLHLRRSPRSWAPSMNSLVHSDSNSPIVSNKSDLSIFDFLIFYWFK